LQQRGLSSKVPLRPPGSEINPEKVPPKQSLFDRGWVAAVFDALHCRRKAADAMLYAFDLLELNGKDPLSAFTGQVVTPRAMAIISPWALCRCLWGGCPGCV
jgi:hypothetical protein